MVTTVDAITTPVPSRADPVNFSARADQFLGELPVFQNQINALASELNVIGDTAENAIIASAAAVTAANYKGDWSAGQSYDTGDSVTYNGGTYQSKTDSNVGNQPDTDPANWKVVITDRVGDIKYTFEAPGGNWKLCDGSLHPIADADGTFATTLNNAQKFVQPGKLADAATALSGTCAEADWTDDSVYLAMAATVTPWIHVYKRSGSTLTKLADPATLPSIGVANGIAISGDGTYVAITGPTSPYVEFYKLENDVLTKLADPATLPAGTGRSVTMSSDGTYCAVGHDTSPYVTIYKRSGDVFTKLADPSTLPTASVQAAEFSKDNGVLVLAESGVGTSVYDRTGDTFALFEVIADAGYGDNVSVNEDGTYIIAGNDGGDVFSVYKRGASAYEELPAADDAPGVSGATDVAISADGRNVAVVGSSSPYIARYRIVNDTLIKLDDMDDMPPSSSRCVAFSGDDNYMMVGHTTSPYFNVYKPTNYDTTVYFRVPYIEPVDRDGLTLEGLNAYLKVNYGGLLNPPAQWADGLLQTVDTLAELPSAADNSGQVRYVEGVGVLKSNGTDWLPIDTKVSAAAFGDLSTDFTATAQAALSSVNPYIIFPEGEYDSTGRLKIPSNKTVEFLPGCIINRAYNQLGFAGAMFINENFLTGDENITIIGGEMAVKNAEEGFCFWFMQVENLAFDKVKVSDVRRSFALMITECNVVTISDCDIALREAGFAEGDGIHLVGCTNVTVNGGRSWAGDDAFSITSEYDFYPDAEISSIPATSTKNVTVNGTSLRSEINDAVKIIIEAAVTNGATIENVNINGCPMAYTEQVATVRDLGRNLAVKNIRITGTAEQIGTQSGSGMVLTAVTDFEIDINGEIKGGTGVGTNIVVDQCGHGGIRGNFVDLGAATQNVLLTACDHVKLHDSQIDGAKGVTVNNSTNCKINDNDITATTALDETGTSDHNTFNFNDVSAATTPLAGVVGASTTFANNRGLVNRAKAVATITASNSSVTVASGIDSALALQLFDISVTPVNTDWSVGGASTYRVQNISGSSFDIALDVATSSAVQFAWSVERKY